jgi:hypothetical protein
MRRRAGSDEAAKSAIRQLDLAEGIIDWIAGRTAHDPREADANLEALQRESSARGRTCVLSQGWARQRRYDREQAAEHGDSLAALASSS